MARFTVNSYRFDPYRNFKFKIKWDNQYVAGLSKCSALRRTTEMTEWREGGRSEHQPQAPRQVDVRGYYPGGRRHPRYRL